MPNPTRVMSHRPTDTADSDRTAPARALGPDDSESEDSVRDSFDFSAENLEQDKNSDPPGLKDSLATVSEDESGWVYRYQLLIRKSDQLVVFLLTAVSLAGMIFYFLYRNHVENGLIEIDRSGRISAAVYQVDINSADWPEFDNLPGIGTAMAKTIVQFRETHGPFRSHDQLGLIDGIGATTIEKLEPHLAPVKQSNNAPADN